MVFPLSNETSIFLLTGITVEANQPSDSCTLHRPRCSKYAMFVVRRSQTDRPRRETADRRRCCSFGGGNRSEFPDGTRCRPCARSVVARFMRRLQTGDRWCVIFLPEEAQLLRWQQQQQQQNDEQPKNDSEDYTRDDV
jgi:hypothetical protein